MYKSNSADLYAFYNSFESLADMLNELKETELDLLQLYIKSISRYRVEKLIKGSQNGYFYRGADINLSDSCLRYWIESVTGDKESVSEAGLRERLKTSAAVIISITESTLLEVKYSAYILLSNSLKEYTNINYPILENAVNTRKRLVSRETDVCMDLIIKLSDSGVAIPKFLIEYYNTNLLPWYRRKCVSEKLMAMGVSEDRANIIMNSKIKLIEVANEVIQESGNIELQERIAKLILLFYNTYMTVTANGKRDINYLAEISMKEVFYTHAKNGDRLATKNEVKMKVAGIFKKDKYFLAKDKRNKLLWLAYFFTGNKKYLKDLEVIKSVYTEFDDKECIINAEFYYTLEMAFSYLMSQKFMKVDSADLLEGRKEIEYLESADDEILDMGLMDKLKIIVERCAKSKNEYDKIAYDISKNALNKKNMTLSEKQVKVINIAYEKCSKVSEGDTELYKEAEQIVKKLKELHRYKPTDFMYKFIDGIKRYKKCSPRQLEILRSELSQYESTDEFEIEGQDDGLDLERYTGNEKTAELDKMLANRDTEDDDDYDLDDIRYTSSEDSNNSEEDNDINLDDLEDDLNEKYRATKGRKASDLGLEESSLYEVPVKRKREKKSILEDIDMTKLVF